MSICCYSRHVTGESKAAPAADPYVVVAKVP